jgi:SOS-response transcriptional repressor LexA
MLSDWLQNVMEQTGIKQAELARLLSDELGRSIDRAAVNKMLKGTRAISGDELLAIERLTQTPVARSSQIEMRSIQVIGHVQAGYWTEAFEWQEDERYSVPVPADPELKPYQLYGAEMRGASMNKWRPEGTVIVFTKQIETGEDMRIGSRYVVERTNGHEFECTVKTLWQDEQGELWLLPESTDPRFQEPIRANGNNGDEVRIIGRVVYSVSKES